MFCNILVMYSRQTAEDHVVNNPPFSVCSHPYVTIDKIEFEPAKERLKEKEIVFVYLTDESSPLTAWQNMIPDISGEHFRLKSAQFQYLKKKFGANGIPSYLVLNKDGEQIYFRVGFEEAESLERIIMDAL